MVNRKHLNQVKTILLTLVFVSTLTALPRNVVKAEEQASSDNINVTRIAGDDRYATSLEISKKGWTNSDYVILATGENYPDALTAVPLAKSTNALLFLFQSIP